MLTNFETPRKGPASGVLFLGRRVWGVQSKFSVEEVLASCPADSVRVHMSHSVLSSASSVLSLTSLASSL